MRRFSCDYERQMWSLPCGWQQRRGHVKGGFSCGTSQTQLLRLDSTQQYEQYVFDVSVMTLALATLQIQLRFHFFCSRASDLYSSWYMALHTPFECSHSLFTGHNEGHAEYVMYARDFLPWSLANHQIANIYWQILCSANVFLQMHVWCHLVTSSTQVEGLKLSSSRLMYGGEQML